MTESVSPVRVIEETSEIWNRALEHDDAQPLTGGAEELRVGAVNRRFERADRIVF
jgi:hypothetical protein